MINNSFYETSLLVHLFLLLPSALLLSLCLQLCVALSAHALRPLVVLHLRRVRAAVAAEDLAAVAAVVLAVGQGEGARALGAGRGLGVVGPLAAVLLRELDLERGSKMYCMTSLYEELPTYIYAYFRIRRKIGGKIRVHIKREISSPLISPLISLHS